jgi:hypothetical protein
MGQDRERLAFAVFVLKSGEIFLAGGIVPQEEPGSVREGPREIGMANVRARGAVAFARRCFGTRDQAAVGDNILDAGETRAVMHLSQPHEAQDFANARHCLEQVERLGIVRLRRVDEVSLQVAQEMIVGVEQRQVPFQAFLDRRVGEPRSDARAVGFVGQLFPDLGPVVLAMRLLDVAQQRRPVPGERHPAPEQVTGRPQIGGIDVRLREPAAAEQDGKRVGVKRVVCGLAAGDRFHVAGMPKHESDPLTSAEVGEPGPR